VQISSVNLTEKRPDIAINVGTFVCKTHGYH